MKPHKRKFGTSLVILLTLSGFLLSVAMFAPAVSGESQSQQLVDGNQYWFGQELVYTNTSVIAGDSWTIVGQTSGNSLTVAAGQDGEVRFDSTALDPTLAQGETFELRNPSGTTVLTFDMTIQSLNAQPPTVDPVYDDGASTETNIGIGTNRSNPPYTLQITEQNDTLVGEDLEAIHTDFILTGDNTVVEWQDIQGNQNPTLDFQGVEPGTYELVWTSKYAVELSQAGTFEPVSSTSTITVENAVGAVSGEATTEDTQYTGNINLVLTEQTTGNEFTKTISGPNETFTFQDVDIGTYDLTASADRHDTTTINNIEVTQNDTTTLNTFELAQSATSIEATVDVNTTGGGTYDGDMTLTLNDTDGNVVDEATVTDETTTTFVVPSTGDYDLVVDGEYIESTSKTVTLNNEGETAITTISPNELDTGTLSVTADTEETVEEIRVTATNVNTNETHNLTIDSSSGTVTKEVIVGDYDLEVDALDHEPRTETVTISANSTTSRSYTLDAKTESVEDLGTYWVGQELDFSSHVSTGDTIEFTNQNSGSSYGYSVADGSDFTISSSQLQSQVGTGELSMAVNGTTQINFNLEEQNLSSEFTSDVSLTDETKESTMTIESNRTTEQTLVATQVETPDGTTLDGSVLATLNDKWTESGTKSYSDISTGDVYYNLDLSSLNLQAGDYVFTVQSEDTPAETTATLTVTEEDTRSVSDLESDATIKDKGMYWDGQVISLESSEVDGSETYRIIKDESLVEELNPRSSDGKLIFDTSWDGYGTGDYVIEDSSGNAQVTFSVEEQSLTADFTDTAVLNTGTQTETNIDFESNRGRYDVIIRQDSGPQDISTTQLANMVSNTTIREVENSEGETVPQVVIKEVTDDSLELIDFQDIDEGSYSFEFEVTDTGVSQTASIDVSGLEDGVPKFTKQFYEENQGNTARIDVVMASGVDETTVEIGNAEVGYNATLVLTNSDPNTANIATIEMDTSKAGQGTPSEAYSIDNSTTVEDLENYDGEETSSDEDSLVGLSVVDESEIEIDGMLQPERYLLQLKMNGNEKDISALKLHELSMEMRGIYVLPQTTSIEQINDKKREELEGDATTDENEQVQLDEPFFGDSEAIQDNVIPEPDTSIIAIKMKGLGNDLMNEDVRASDFAKGSSTVDSTGAYLTIEQTGDTEPNRAETEIPISALDYRYNSREEYIYFVLEPEKVDEAKVGQSFKATFTIDDRSPALSEGREMVVEQEFEIVETTIDWGMDTIQVEPKMDEPIVAQTNYTPGTDVELLIMSKDTRYPFLYLHDTEVNDDGTISGEFNFRGAPIGTEGQVQIQNLTDPIDLEVVEDAERPDFVDEPDSDEEEETVPLTVVLENPDGESITGSVTVDGNTKTATNGNVSFDVTPNTQYTIEASADQYQESSTTITTSGSATEETLTLNPAEDTGDEDDEEDMSYTIDFTVNDEDTGESIEGATVTAGGTETTTDSNGEASVVVEGSDTYTMIISADGYESWTSNVTVDSDKSTTIELTPTGTDSSDDSDSDSTDDTTTTTSDDNNGDTDDTDDTDDSVRSEGQNGFGLITALIALTAALIARRVRS